MADKLSEEQKRHLHNVRVIHLLKKLEGKYATVDAAFSDACGKVKDGYYGDADAEGNAALREVISIFASVLREVENATLDEILVGVMENVEHNGTCLTSSTGKRKATEDLEDPRPSTHARIQAGTF